MTHITGGGRTLVTDWRLLTSHFGSPGHQG
jgi:hypothetical protein